jgi:hypothetical protein
MIFKHMRRAILAGVTSLLFCACSHPSNQFVGTWTTPSDGNRFVISDHDVTASGPSTKEAFKMRYIFHSSSEIVMLNDHDQAVLVFDISQDGKTLQVVSQQPFGSGTYIATRVK